MNQRFVLIIFALILAASFAGWWFANQPRPVPAPERTSGQAANEFIVNGNEFSFSPSTITVRRGERVKLAFKNVGSITHTYTIEKLNLDTGLVSPGSSKTLEFNAPANGGVLTFQSICTVPGHKEAGMVGTLKVE